MQLFTEQRVLANGMAQFEFNEVWPGIEKARPTRALLESLAMPKLAELRSLLHELTVEQGRKVVVFSAWRRALRLADWAVAAPLRQHGVRSAFFTGAESLRRRNENIVAFHDDPATRISEGVKAARRAVALDEKDAHAYAVLARILAMNGEHDAALMAGEKAVGLNPNNAQVRFGNGQVLTYAGRSEEALSELDAASPCP